MKILIVKTSSLGDIIQCFPVLQYLHQINPNVEIDWIVEESYAQIVKANPLVKHVIIKKFSFANFLQMRKSHYQYVFDLQGNCKSGLITFFTKADFKIGFSYFCVREWPNVLATNTRFSVPKDINIRLQYLSLFEQFFKKITPLKKVENWLKRTPKSTEPDFCKSLKKQEKFIETFYLKKDTNTVMVAPGSKWDNKQLKKETLQAFLSLLEQKYEMHFLFVWGSDDEKELCEQMKLKNRSILPSRLSIPEWRELMKEMNLVIAVDSSALHLCGTTNTPSFSIFGPTSSSIFKPLGEHHYAFQGRCPYNKVFLKQCPLLRTCPTGACIKDISPDVLLEQFSSWWESISKNKLMCLFSN